MSEAPGSDLGSDDFDLREAGERYDAFVERAREHYPRTGEWPPDPLLDEIDEIRRRIMAEHDNDWRKVLRWHLEQDKLYAEQNPDASSRRSAISPPA